jgi:hypothetical protein
MAAHRIVLGLASSPFTARECIHPLVESARLSLEEDATASECDREDDGDHGRPSLYR